MNLEENEGNEGNKGNEGNEEQKEDEYKKTCIECGHINTNIQGNKLKCARCKHARYCNTNCQKTHWAAVHKYECIACNNPNFDSYSDNEYEADTENKDGDEDGDDAGNEDGDGDDIQATKELKEKELNELKEKESRRAIIVENIRIARLPKLIWLFDENVNFPEEQLKIMIGPFNIFNLYFYKRFITFINQYTKPDTKCLVVINTITKGLLDIMFNINTDQLTKPGFGFPDLQNRIITLTSAIDLYKEKNGKTERRNVDRLNTQINQRLEENPNIQLIIVICAFENPIHQIKVNEIMNEDTDKKYKIVKIPTFDNFREEFTQMINTKQNKPKGGKLRNTKKQKTKQKTKTNQERNKNKKTKKK